MVDQVILLSLLGEYQIIDCECQLFRKIFGTNHRKDLTPEVVSLMSVNTLAEQRMMLEDAALDSE